MIARAGIGDLLEAALEVTRPFPRMAPSEFASRFRVLKEGTTARPGPWSNDVFPYLGPIMDAVEEAIESGRNLILMKSAQGGGSEAIINALCWLLTYYPGPALYLISKDELASEFGRDRFAPMCETCEPVARKHLSGKTHGEKIQTKRFIDGKLVIAGGRSVLNLQSQPYRIVIIDEVDSLLDEMKDGDPVKLAEVRTDAFSEFGPTIIIAFAHPSSKDRGAGKLYYGRSDRRRGFIVCPHCSGEFWLQWAHVKVLPQDGEDEAAAARNPDAYRYVTPCCAVELTDAQRLAAVRQVRQRTTLDPVEARRKKWIGLHFSQLYSKALRWLADEYIQGLDDPSIAKVFRNKREGDVYEVAESENVDAEAWRACITLPRWTNDPASYHRGEVPSEVAYLTAATDHNSTHLHWMVWGWGLLPARGGERVPCGWLIDWGEIERNPPVLSLEAVDLAQFDPLIYTRKWTRADGLELKVSLGGHDSGWLPNGVYEYSRRRPKRAIPTKGGSSEEAPLIRWGKPPVYLVNGIEVRDPELRFAVLNTFTAKRSLYGLVSRRFDLERDGAPPERDRWRLHLPIGTEDQVIEQLSNEYLAQEKKRLVWKKRGPNHFADCAMQAFVLARNLDPLQGGRTAEEIDDRVEPRPQAVDEPPERARVVRRPPRVRRQY